MRTKSCFFAAALLLGCTLGHAQVDVAAATPQAGLASAAALGTGAAEDMARFSEAVQLYRAGRWSAAYGRFLALADRGNVDAARISLLMLRHGRELYDTEWTAAPSQVGDWERLVGAGTAFKVAAHGE